MKGKLKNLIFILVLGSICASILLGIRSYTFPKIERYQELKLKSTILEAAGIYYDEDNINKVFDENIRVMRKDGFLYYMSPDNLYIFKYEGRGLWGMIEGVVILNPDLETVENISIVFQEETPGLGGRISEEGFLAQFKKKKVSPKLFLTLRRKASRVNEVDAITGASMTSQALIDMINESVANFRNIMEEPSAHK